MLTRKTMNRKATTGYINWTKTVWFQHRLEFHLPNYMGVIVYPYCQMTSDLENSLRNKRINLTKFSDTLLSFIAKPFGNDLRGKFTLHRDKL